MKVTYRVPTKDPYAFVEVLYEHDDIKTLSEVEMAREISDSYNTLKREINGGDGVGIPKLAEIVTELVKTGGIVEGGNYDFSASESLLVGAITKLLRKEKQ